MTRRQGQHYNNGKTFKIREIARMQLSRSDARAVEQVLIEEYGGSNGSQLENKINSISQTKNPALYARSIRRGCQILGIIGYSAPNVCG